MTNDRRLAVGILLVIQPASRSTGVNSGTTLRLKVKPILQPHTISALILLKLRSLHTQHGLETGNAGSYAAGVWYTNCVRVCEHADAMMWYHNHCKTKPLYSDQQDLRSVSSPPMRDTTTENANFHLHKQAS